MFDRVAYAASVRFSADPLPRRARVTAARL
jgi:hypothetical protein